MSIERETFTHGSEGGLSGQPLQAYPVPEHDNAASPHRSR